MPDVPSKRLAARTALKAILTAKMAAIFPDDMPAGWPQAPIVRDGSEEPVDTPAGGEVALETGTLSVVPVEFGAGRPVYEHRMTVPLALFANHDNPDLQAAGFDAIQRAIGAVIEADNSLGGVVDFCEFTESENDQLGGEGNPTGESARVPLDLVWHASVPFS